MKFEDVKVGMRVIFNSIYERDTGIVTHVGVKEDSGQSNSVWIKWDSDGSELWLLAADFEPEESVTPYKLTQADYQLLKEVLKELLNPLEEVLQYKNAFSREEVRKMVAKRNKLAALQWKIKKEIT